MIGISISYYYNIGSIRSPLYAIDNVSDLNLGISSGKCETPKKQMEMLK